MPTVKLTQSAVVNAQPSAKRFILWDEALAGFGLRVEVSGRKSFIARYRAEGGGRRAPLRLVTIGSHTELTADEARREAKKFLGAAATGADPAGERHKQRREMTIAELVDLYEQQGLIVQKGKRKGVAMKPMTAAYTLARLKNHVVPLMGNRRISSISEAEIVQFATEVAAGKSRTSDKERAEQKGRRRKIVRGGEGAARKVVRDLSAVFTFAISHRLIDRNPVSAASVYKVDNKRERFLSLDELRAIGRALDELAGEGVNPKALTIIRLLALTGCRRDEIVRLKWSEVDLSSNQLRLEETKTGRSKRPLGAGARNLLVEIPVERDEKGKLKPWVFPAERGEGPYAGLKRAWARMAAKAKLDKGVSPHVLRHSVGALAASGGEALLIVGALLGHANTRSTALYAHVAADAAQKAADRATSTISAALANAPAAKVVKLAERSRARK